MYWPPRFSILFNGSPFGYFKSERGIRLRDPMSPDLFTIFSDFLSRILTHAAEDNKFLGIKISRDCPKVTHLMYADDLIIYCKANINEAKSVTEYLQLYCSWSGQEINWHKSSIHFSSNVSRRYRNNLMAVMGIHECSHKGTYLGHAFCKFK